MVKINLVYVVVPFFVSSAVGSYIPQQYRSVRILVLGPGNLTPEYRRDCELVYTRSPDKDANVILGRSGADPDPDLERREPFLPLVAGALRVL